MNGEDERKIKENGLQETVVEPRRQITRPRKIASAVNGVPEGLAEAKRR
jgi:hypothetical protein